MSDSFPLSGFARLAAIEDRNYWFRARNRLIVWALGRYFAQMRRYLEVGCGTGCVLAAVEAAFPDAELLGSELYSGGLEFAARRVRRAALVQMDAGSLTFREEFDVLGCFDVLEHIADDRGVLEHCCRALRPGGGILVTVPQHRFLWSALDEYTRHVRRYTRGELLDKMAAAGFTPLLVTSFVSLLLPAMLAARLRRRRLESGFDPQAEFKVGAVMNFTLERVLDFERLLIRGGLRFPFGGSLLVVARKPHVDRI
jgi:SAM-dependent methyltransferase